MRLCAGGSSMNLRELVMTNSNGSFSVNLSVLNGKSLEKWCIQMQVIFGFPDVFETVKCDNQVLQDNSTETQMSSVRW
jgi:hypothetical protein